MAGSFPEGKAARASIVLVLVAIPCGIAAWIYFGSRDHPFEALAQEARELQREGDLAQAGEKWRTLVTKIDAAGPPERWGELRKDAEETIKSINQAQQRKGEIESLAECARELQVGKNADEAREKWREVLARIEKEVSGSDPANGIGPFLADLREEAERNIRMIDDMHPKTPVTEVEFPDPPKDPPEEVPEDRLEEHYRKGRKLHGHATLQVWGAGSNERWLIKTDAKFFYQYLVKVETEVTENDGLAVTFVQRFPVVLQELAVFESTVQLRELSPVVGETWRAFENSVLIDVPGYTKVRKLVRIAEIVDPNLKRTLTAFRDALERAGLIKSDSQAAELACQIEKFSGTESELIYRSGFGVTRIKLLRGPENAFDRNDLERLAYGSSLLMDYFIFPGAGKKVGDTWDVRARDVAAFFNLYGTKVDGKLMVKRDKDIEPNKVAQLKIVGGELSAQGENRGVRQSAALRPKPGGFLEYSVKDLYVQKAEAEWDVQGEWITTRHLLFGTRNMRDVRVKSFYEAQRRDASPEDKPREAEVKVPADPQKQDTSAGAKP